MRVDVVFDIEQVFSLIFNLEKMQVLFEKILGWQYFGGEIFFFYDFCIELKDVRVYVYSICFREYNGKE